MLVLRTSPNSPFGRIISMAMAVLGLSDRVNAVKTDTGDASDSQRL